VEQNQGFCEKSAATASVILPKQNYYAAIEAHQEGKQVKVVGTMSGQGSGRKIDCNHLEALEYLVA